MTYCSTDNWTNLPLLGYLLLSVWSETGRLYTLITKQIAMQTIPLVMTEEITSTHSIHLWIPEDEICFHLWVLPTTTTTVFYEQLIPPPRRLFVADPRGPWGPGPMCTCKIGPLQYASGILPLRINCLISVSFMLNLTITLTAICSKFSLIMLFQEIIEVLKILYDLKHDCTARSSIVPRIN